MNLPGTSPSRTYVILYFDYMHNTLTTLRFTIPKSVGNTSALAIAWIHKYLPRGVVILTSYSIELGRAMKLMFLDENKNIMPDDEDNDSKVVYLKGGGEDFPSIADLLDLKDKE